MVETSPAFYAGSVWDQLRAELDRRRTAPAHVAIAYLGSNADALLAGLRRGDVLVCDASDRAIRNGSTDVRQLQRLLARGIDLYTHQGMHSKCAQIGSRVLVGSANASRFSAEHRAEAVLALTSKSIAEQVRRHVLDLTGPPGRPLDQTELEMLAQVPVKPIRLPKQERPGSVLPTGARVWLIPWDWLLEDWTEQESDEFFVEDRAARGDLDRADRLEVLRWHDECRLAEGDYLCFLNPDERDIYPPARILAVRRAADQTGSNVYYVVRGELDKVSADDTWDVLEPVWPETSDYDPIEVPASHTAALNSLPWARPPRSLPITAAVIPPNRKSLR